jgi:ribosome-binding factor A
MDNTRQRKVAREIQRHLSEILQREVEGAENMIITVSYVRITPDLGLAYVYLTVLPEAMLRTLLTVLNAEGSPVRQLLAKRMRNQLRLMPELRFFEDDQQRTAAQLDALMSGLEIPAERELDPEEYPKLKDEDA